MTKFALHTPETAPAAADPGGLHTPADDRSLARGGLNTLSNYTNHIAKTPLNEQFAGENEKWSRELKAA